MNPLDSTPPRTPATKPLRPPNWGPRLVATEPSSPQCVTPRLSEDAMQSVPDLAQSVSERPQPWRSASARRLAALASPASSSQSSRSALAASPLGLGSPIRLSDAGRTQDASDRPLRVRSQQNYPLFLGSYAAASNQAALRAMGITHIVNATCEYENTFPGAFEYLHIAAKDSRNERLSPYFPVVSAYVTQACAQGGKVLVHCQHGISRSVTLLVASMMAMENKRLKDVLGPLTLLRSEVEPNPSFMYELRAWENYLFGNVTSLQQLTLSDPLHTLQPDAPGPSYEAALMLASMQAVNFSSQEERDHACADVSHLLRGLTPRQRDLEVVDIIKGVAQAYGTRSERDARARAAVGMILCGLQNSGTLTTAQISQIFDNVVSDEGWQDFVMDLPYAAGFLRVMRADSVVAHEA
jgi:hypothetical protein